MLVLGVQDVLDCAIQITKSSLYLLICLRNEVLFTLDLFGCLAKGVE